MRASTSSTARPSLTRAADAVGGGAVPAAPDRRRAPPAPYRAGVR